jgi:hypothetical protein
MRPEVTTPPRIAKKKRTARFEGLLQKLGSGLVTGASDDDPSGIGTYSQVGRVIRLRPVVDNATMKLTSFEADIRPLFTDRDIHAMSKAFNLASYEDVKKHAAAIYDRIRGIGGAVMPPPPPRGEGPWPQARIELFAKRMAEGFQP